MDIVAVLIKKIKDETANNNIKKYCDAVDIILSLNLPKTDEIVPTAGAIEELIKDIKMPPKLVDEVKLPRKGVWVRHLHAFMKANPQYSKTEAIVEARKTYTPVVKEKQKGVPDISRVRRYAPRTPSLWLKYTTEYQKQHPEMSMSEVTLECKKTYGAWKTKMEDDAVIERAKAQPVIYADTYQCVQKLPDGVSFIMPSPEEMKKLAGTGVFVPPTN